MSFNEHTSGLSGRELFNIMNDPSTVGARIFIGNIPAKMDKEELEDKFSMYGKITGLIPKNGFAFVQYENEQAANDAISNERGKTYYGRKLDVKAATQRKEGGVGPPPDMMERDRSPLRSLMDIRGDRPRDWRDRDRFDGPGGFGGRGAGRGGRARGGSDRDPMDRNPPMERFGRDDFRGHPDDFHGPSDDFRGPPDDIRGGADLGRDFNGPPRGRGLDSRGLEPRGMEPRGMEPRGMEPRGMESRGMEPRGMESRGLEPRGLEPRGLESRGLEPRGMEPRGLEPRGLPPAAHDYPPVDPLPIIAERTNDCEIIVVNKMVREYAEFIERRLIKIGLTVDLLFPNEEVPLGRVLANISGRGTLFAIIVNMTNEEHRSLTLNLLYGQPQEHRNMPLEDALAFIARSFDTYLRGERGQGPGPVAVGQQQPDRHPEAIQTLLNLLRENRQLTVLQYDKVIKYLQEKREIQIKLEVGDAQGLPSIAPDNPPTTKQQAELQHRIMNILNQSGPGSQNNQPPPPQAVPSPWQQPAPTPAPLLNDPTVQKALDSLIQGDLLKKINPGTPTPVRPPQPLFGAYAGNRR